MPFLKKTPAMLAMKFRLKSAPPLQGRLLILMFLGPVLSCLAVQSATGQNTPGWSGNSQVEEKPEGLVSNLSMSASSGQRYLMLHNGAVFQGQIEKTDDRWKVTLDETSTLYFANYRVNVIADSMEDLYTYRSQRVSQYDQQQRVDLFLWCLKYELASAAEKELKKIEQLKIDPALKKSLAFRLKQQVDPIQFPSMSATLKAMAETKARREAIAEAAKQKPIQMVQRPSQSLQQTAADLSSTPSEMLPGTLNQEPNASVSSGSVTASQSTAKRDNHQLLSAAAMARTGNQSEPVGGVATTGGTDQASLPVASVFSIYDQPGLQNPPEIQQAIDNQMSQNSISNFSQTLHGGMLESCAGCHFEGNGKTKFELKLASDPATVVGFNLQQIQGLLNRQNPGNSELLTIAFQPHGGLKAAPIAEGSDLQKELVGWVYGTRVEDAGGPVEKPQVMLAGAEMAIPPAEVAPHALAPNSEAASEPAGLEPSSPELPSSLLYAPRAKPTQPYDPQFFNQQIAGHAEADAPTAAGVGLPSAISPAAVATPKNLPSSSGLPRRNSLFQLRRKPESTRVLPAVGSLPTSGSLGPPQSRSTNNGQ